MREIYNQKSYSFGLWHVGDDSICEDEQYEVLRPVPELSSYVCHVVDCGSEVGRTVQLDLTDARFVSREDAC